METPNACEHIAGYHFFQLKDKEALREPLLHFCQQLSLKGTILLSNEGINFYVAGFSESLEKLKRYLHQELKIPPIEYQKTECHHQPYNRMCVKLKKEIISMGVKTLRLEKGRAPYIEPEVLKEWYENGKEFLILDTRNEFEIDCGKFKNAESIQINTFSQFPEKMRNFKEKYRNKTVVTYCTGGIRCEKAATFMEKELGIQEVYQLHGGILGYFEKCGNAHFEGDCFVFDQRREIKPPVRKQSS